MRELDQLLGLIGAALIGALIANIVRQKTSPTVQTTDDHVEIPRGFYF